VLIVEDGSVMAEQRTTARLVCAVLGTLLGLGAVGCGGAPERAPGSRSSEKPSARQLLQEAVAATQGAHSMRIAGRAPLDEDGQLAEIDLSLDEDGNCAGTFGIDRGTAEIIATDGASYLRGDRAFWKAVAGDQAEGILRFLRGRWAKAEGEDAEELAAVCDLDEMLGGFDTDEVASADVSQEQLTAVGGVPAVRLVSEEDDGLYDVWIATRGTPYLLQVVGPHGVLLEFTEYDEPVHAVPPDPQDVAEMTDAV
jgi:hypothetical protein